jgi:hypothetical protein
MTTQEDLIKDLESEIYALKTSIVLWQDKIASLDTQKISFELRANGVSIFEKSAKYSRLYEVVRILSVRKADGSFLTDVKRTIEYVQDRVSQMARVPARSSDPVENVMSDFELAAYADILEFMRRM